MSLTLTSPYFAVVELEEADLPIYTGAVQAVKTQLLDAVLRKYRAPKLVIASLNLNVYAALRYGKVPAEDTIYLNNRPHLPPNQKQQADFVAYRGQNENEYRQGFLIHECGHWLWRIAPQIRERIEGCRGRPECNFISNYARFDGSGEYFSENLLAFEWFGEGLRTFDLEAYAMVKEALEILV